MCPSIAWLAAAASVVSAGGDALASISSWNLGELNFSSSAATPLAASRLELGLKLLHHFQHGLAIQAFQEAAAAEDGGCLPIAAWGVAMANNIAFWGVEDLEGSAAAIRAMRDSACGPANWRARSSPRERLYIAAVDQLGNTSTAVSREQRYRDYVQTMGELRRRWPSDQEAAAMHVLGQLAHAFPYQRGYAARVAPVFAEAAGTLAAVLAAHPAHPGALHYTIHLFDTPRRAGDAQAQRAAGLYGRDLPAVPHAIHMASHLHLRLGKWAEAASANEVAWSSSCQLLSLTGWDSSRCGGAVVVWCAAVRWRGVGCVH